MNNLSDIKTLWQAANIQVLPSSEEIVMRAKKFQRERLNKKWVVIVCSLVLAVFILLITFTAPFKLFSTYVGGSLIALSAFFIAMNNLMSLKRFYQSYDFTNKQFLDFVEQTRLNQIYYFRRTQKIIMLLSLIGIILYLYEPATKAIVFTTVLFIMTTGFMIWSWFFLRPRTFRKNQETLAQLIAQLKEISNQLN